jgi:hypothetical protein
MAWDDATQIAANSLGMTPEAYDVLRQKVNPVMLASMGGQKPQEPTQADINAQTMSADQAPPAPDQEAPAPSSNNLSMPPQDISGAPPSEELTAPDFSGQKQNIADMKAGLQKYLGQNQQIDLSPLAALTDAWSHNGSKLAQAYKAPTSDEERQLQAQKLRAGINQAQTGLSTEQAKYLTAKAQQEATKAYREQMLEAKKQTAILGKAAKHTEDMDKNAIKLGEKAESFRGNSAVQKSNENLVYAQNALSLLDEAPGGDLSKLNSTQVALFNEEMGKLAKGGASTEGTRHSIEASTLESNWNKLLQTVGGQPTGAQLGAFLIQNKHYIEAMRDNYGNVVNKYRKNIYDTYEPSISDTAAQRYKARYPEVFAPKSSGGNSGSGNLGGQDNSEALNWINDPANADDPRLPQVKAALGVK